MPTFFSGGVRAAVIRVLITGIAVFLAVMIVPGLEIDSFGAGLAAVLVLLLPLARAAELRGRVSDALTGAEFC
jgi:hypothetical protein